MIEDNLLERIGSRIYGDLGMIDDIPLELSNTVANIYLRNCSLFDSKGYIPKTKLKDEGLMSQLENFAHNYAEIVADKDFIKNAIMELRKIDKYKMPKEYNVAVDFILDICKYNIKNSETKLFILRKIERKFKKSHVNEIANLYDSVKGFILKAKNDQLDKKQLKYDGLIDLVKDCYDLDINEIKLNELELLWSNFNKYLLTTLTARQELIIKTIYGIERERQTIDKLSKLFGVERETINEVKIKAFERFRHHKYKSYLFGIEPPSEIIQELEERIEIIEENECFNIDRGLNELKIRVGDIPEAFKTAKEVSPHCVKAFDVNSFFSVFDRVKLQDGYVLDYIYARDTHGGEPLIYARKINQKPISNINNYYSTFGISKPSLLLGEEPSEINTFPYLKNIKFEKSYIGFFQFALFCMCVRRFYLIWHSNYNNRQFILTKEVLNNFIQNKVGLKNGEEIALLKSVDIRPKVIIKGNSAGIIILCYEINIGYSKLHILIKWPNIFENKSDEILIKTHTRLLY